jgi:KDO2-lipid IV(A) lauroyltransferase
MKSRYKIEYAALRAALFIFKILPINTASALGGAIFQTVGPRMGVSKIARRNIAMCFPDWPQTKIEATVKAMWNNMGRVVAEYPHLEKIATSPRITFKNEHHFEAIKNSNHAAIMVSGHLGNWELLPPALLFNQNIPMHSVYRAPNNPFVDKMLVRLRSFGGRLKSFGKSRKGLAQTLRALENKEIIGMLIDQKMNTGLETLFFDKPAMTSTAFVELAKKLGCPVIPGRIIRTQGCRFEIEILPALTIEGRDTSAIIGDMHAILEGWITEHPGQWLWLHRRWKKHA